jgi:hypothetical protein
MAGTEKTEKTVEKPKGPPAGLKVEEDDDGNLLLAGTRERVGISPETGEIVSVSPATLMAAKGLDRREAWELYARIARAGGYFNPEAEPTEYQPDLPLKGLKGKQKEAVEKLLGL